MAIEDLLAVLPPPQSPIELGKASAWQSLEDGLKVKLPTDWCDFALAYGSGHFGDGIRVFNPLSPSFKEFFRKYISYVRRIDLPYDCYPRAPGLFPWGSDENGNKMFWLTDGQPDAWPIILRREDGAIERWELPITSLLAGALASQIHCITWPMKFPKKHRLFTPRRQVF